MPASLTEEELARLEALEAAATPGPWRSMRDGNQYINTRFLPTAKLVGASRLDGVTRPWNPNKYVTFGFKPEEFETARFKDADADFIAAMRNALPALLASARAVRSGIAECERIIAATEPHQDDYGASCVNVEVKRILAALTATAEPTAGEDEAPYVCPGCHAVAEPLGQLSTGSDGPTGEELSVLYHQSGRVSVSPHTSGFCPEVGFRALYAAGSASRQPEVDRLTAGIEGLTARLATVESERAAEVDRLTAENARLERAALGSEFNRDTERLRIDELSKELNEALQELRKRDDRG